MDLFDCLSQVSTSSALAYSIIALGALHWILSFFELAILSLREIIWNAVVYVFPARLLLDTARRQELEANDMLSQIHAAKGDALRRILGVGGDTILKKLPNAGEAIGMGAIMQRASTSVSSRAKISDAPAGLGNWDNSCYQNSVLQALSSLGSLRAWLRVSEPLDGENESTTNTALQGMIMKLRDSSNNGRHIWTPAKLKNMSSWQQQDAQEYFSKIVHELDKEAARTLASREAKPGLETVLGKRKVAAENADQGSEDIDIVNTAMRNPLEGLVAQRVACTKCGFSEGYSMMPFNCLTVPLGSNGVYDLNECLDEYTKSEDIEGVECRNCTLIHAEQRLKQLQLPPELREQIVRRLRAIELALEKDDFSDKALKEDCQIPVKAFISSTKTREAVIGRAPQSLVIHVNRSVFDEQTGMQRKNYATVRYPLVLDLRHWMLKAGETPAHYRLSAVVTHYGRHENGHYICYREHPRAAAEEALQSASSRDDDNDEEKTQPWYRLSDEDVSPISEQDVLNQGGVFMLFYEKSDPPVVPQPQPHKLSSAVTATDLPNASDLKAAAVATALPSSDDGNSEYGEDEEEEAADWDDLLLSATTTRTTATPSLVTNVSSAAQSVVSESDTDMDEHDEFVTSAEEKEGRERGPLSGAAAASAALLKTGPLAYMLPGQKDLKPHDINVNRSVMSV